MFHKQLILFIGYWAPIVMSVSPQILKGPCPTINYERDFSIADLNGTWYEIGYYNRGFPYYGDCVSYKFSSRYVNKYGYDVDIVKRGLGVGTIELYPKLNGKSAFNLVLNYPDEVVTRNEGYSFYIMGTDFQCVASVYTCRTIGDSHISSAYVLSTDTTGLCYLLRNGAKPAHDIIRQIPDLKSELFIRNEQIVGCHNKAK